jgi:hypothetical protein
VVYPIANTAADTSYLFTKGVRYLKGKIWLSTRVKSFNVRRANWDFMLPSFHSIMNY